MLSKRSVALLALLSIAICTGQAAAQPVKVYILAGQSNMEGQAKVETFDYIGDDPATAPMLKEMRGPDGTPRVCERVWISYLTGSPDRGTLGEGLVSSRPVTGRVATRRKTAARSARSLPSA